MSEDKRDYSQSEFSRPKPIVQALHEKREREGVRFVQPQRIDLRHPLYFDLRAITVAVILSVVVVGISLTSMVASMRGTPTDDDALPPIPGFAPDMPMVTMLPDLLVIPDVPLLPPVKLSYQTPPPEPRPVPKPAPKMARALPKAEPSAPLPPEPADAAEKEKSPFAETAIIYSAPGPGEPAGESTGDVGTTSYRVVSIVSDELALISADVAGHKLVSPYHVGQTLPDGRVIKVINTDAGVVETNDGKLAASRATMTTMAGG